jgi:predicted nucleic acid-binding protein
VIGRVLLDTSAWTRFGNPNLAPGRVSELGAAVSAARLIVSLPFLLEVGYSARDAEEHARLVERLTNMPALEIDAAAEARALDAQQQLARTGHHRLPPGDVTIAALADRYGVGVLHYDRHFDLISERTDLDFESVWLAEPGSLD